MNPTQNIHFWNKSFAYETSTPWLELKRVRTPEIFGTNIAQLLQDSTLEHHSSTKSLRSSLWKYCYIRPIYSFSNSVKHRYNIDVTYNSFPRTSSRRIFDPHSRDSSSFQTLHYIVRFKYFWDLEFTSNPKMLDFGTGGTLANSSSECFSFQDSGTYFPIRRKSKRVKDLIKVKKIYMKKNSPRSRTMKKVSKQKVQFRTKTAAKLWCDPYNVSFMWSSRVTKYFSCFEIISFFEIFLRISISTLEKTQNTNFTFKFLLKHCSLLGENQIPSRTNWEQQT